jgi:hypothetical protein
MRWSRILAPLLILVIAVACSSQETVTNVGSDATGGGGGNGSEESQAAEATPEATDDDGGSGGNGGSTDDAEEAFERLTPPNAEEVTKTTASGVIFAAFTSPDSVDSLVSFYEDAFDDLGLQILTTTETSGGISWFVGTDENASEFGGVISVIPNQEGTSGSAVSVQIGSTNSN